VDRDTPRERINLGPTQDLSRTWYQNPKWIAAIAFLVFAFAISAWAVVAVVSSRTLDEQVPVIEQMKVIAENNRTQLEQLSRNQAGIDELVEYVHQAQQQAASGQQSQAVRLLIKILCASSDPVRVETCQQTGVSP
jgi:hypothetical protein